MENLENTQIAERDVQAASGKPNLSSLSSLANDPSLNAELGIVVKKEEPIVEKTETHIDEIKLDEAKEEIKTEVKEEVKSEDVLALDEIKLDETPIELDEKEPEEGSWLHVAKTFEIKDVKEDSFEAVKEAIVKPYIEQLESARTQNIEELLSDVDPETRLEVDLQKAGMTKEQIRQPFTLANQYKSMDAVALVRADLEALYGGKAKSEWIDSEMEKVNSYRWSY